MNLEELENAVSRLSPNEYDSFRDWFAEFDMTQWDKQIETDSDAGRLDGMIKKALEDYEDLKALREAKAAESETVSAPLNSLRNDLLSD